MILPWRTGWPRRSSSAFFLTPAPAPTTRFPTAAPIAGAFGPTPWPPQSSGTGSRLWLLSREKTLPEVLRRAHDYAAEALRWLVDDGVASRVDVSAAMPRLGLLSLAVNITLVNGESSTYAFSYPLE